MRKANMATGRSNKLVGQTGEYLVAAELSRRGLIATTFTGNVPHYDIIASDESGRHVSVQVKASRGPTWQFGNIALYCDITFDGKRQIVGKKKLCPVRRLIMVFVRIDAGGNDCFYILPWERFRDMLVTIHEEYLAKHNGTRPKKWDSLHSAISETHLEPYRDNWSAVEKNLK
jgi:Holliday junction resolvase-like predicted endonuclease